MSSIYTSDGTLLQNPDKLDAIQSISVKYGRLTGPDYGASYYFCRIPRRTIGGKFLRPKMALTTVSGELATKTSDNTSALGFAQRNPNAVFAMNASLFFTRGERAGQPQGQTIINSASITDVPMLDDMGTAISADECYPLCIDANGDLSAPYERLADGSTDEVATHTAEMIEDGVVYACTGWGQFIEDYAKADVSKYNEIVHTGKYIRQVIGQFQNGDWFTFTCDALKGSITTNESGLTYDVIASYLISKGAKFAYALDGGGSAQTVIGEMPVNPIYEGAIGRATPVVIYFEVAT